MKNSILKKTKKLLVLAFVFTAFCLCLSFESQAAMSFDEMRSRLSAYSDSITKTEDDTMYIEYPGWDISEENLYCVISDIASSLMGEPVEDYCKVYIKFYYTDKLYGTDFQTFGDNLFRVKKMFGNFWTEWSRYHKMDITVTSYNRVCDEYSANITLSLNGSESGEWGEKYDEKLLELVAAAKKSCSSNMEIAQYFLKWLDENNSYNIFTGYTNDPYYAMIVGKTVCGGYANAFKDLCNAAGIPAIVPVNQELNHAWSQVFVDGKWYTADLCNVVKSKSNTYNGYLFDDPDVPMDCKSFVDEHKEEYIDSFRDIGKTDVSALETEYEDSFVYSGTSIIPEVTVKHAGKVLQQGVHYKLTCSSNRYPGTGKITIEGIGKNGYKGTAVHTFKIILEKPQATAEAGRSSVQLKWKKIDGADGYIIRVYNPDKNKFEDIDKVTGTSCTVKNLKSGTKYVFAIRGYVSASGKEYKGEYTKLSLKTLPGKLKIVKITAARHDTLKVKWSKNDSAGKYELYISTDGKSWDKLADTEKLSYKVTGLEGNTKYYFKVRAVTDKGKGSFSAKKSKTTLLEPPELTAVSENTGEISVSWNKTAKAKGYVISYCRQKGMINSEKLTVKKGSTTSTVIASLKSNKNYYIRVRAFKTVKGERVYGQYSTTVKVRTK